MVAAELVVVMGVSATGKSTVGRLLAGRLGVGFADADDLHPPANVAKMEAGIPLTDADRGPWLEAVGAALAASAGAGLVMACSALKRSYRSAILGSAPGVSFVELDGDRALLERRMSARHGHFMPLSLLDSQLQTLEPLEPDEPGFRVDIAPAPAQIVEEIVSRLGR